MSLYMWWPRTTFSSMYTASALHLPSFSHKNLIEAYGVGVANIAIELQNTLNKYAICVQNITTHLNP